jgi:hypothetical protein
VTNPWVLLGLWFAVGCAVGVLLWFELVLTAYHNRQDDEREARQYGDTKPNVAKKDS